ncbi:thrombospondin-type laminin G domain and EAR repeat-containing protein-like [Corticium candelabrum]|uniref:thrombospondin-type laminin G domain and EAR repeat-containing protein-like n=1 Tax=Corticium candelabrum TaxID=121492 RepID=UPI002E252BFF|nr:thrombospondin-type laminin G domain and EAR repeat-containing protein-like [Corticium candelabrum]
MYSTKTFPLLLFATCLLHIAMGQSEATAIKDQVSSIAADCCKPLPPACRDGRDGKDGRDGRDGSKGEQGEKGQDCNRLQEMIVSLKQDINELQKKYNHVVERLLASASLLHHNYDHSALSQGWWSPVFVYRVYHLASYENYESISFQIGNKQYVAVPNYRNNNNRYDTDSVIYKYEGNEFVRYQSIRTDGANGERFFEIESEHFLVIAQHYGQTDKHAVSSTIYKWDGIKFKKYQQLKTRSVSTACHFTIDSKHYLAFGKGTTGDNSKSQIYVWNGTQFQFYQHLTSHRTVNIQSFQENGSHYLFLSSFQDRSDDSYNTNSFLFKWSGAQFELHQSIPTRGCRFPWI